MDAFLLSLFSAAVLTWLFACIGLWIWAIGRIVSGREIVEFVPRPPFPCGIAEILVAIGVFFVVLAGLRGWIAPAPGSKDGAASVTDLVPIIVANSAATSTAVALVLVWSALLRLSPRAMGLVPKWRDLVLGVAAVLMLIPPVLALQGFLSTIYEYKHPLLEVLKEPQPILTLAVMAISSTIIAPVTEEFFFRGLIQGWFGRLAERRRGRGANVSAPQPPVKAALVGEEADASTTLNPYSSGEAESHLVGYRPRAWWPIVASSLLFAAVHAGQGPAPISLFFLALGLGYLYRQTGRIWAGVILHMGLNGLSTTATILTTLFGE